MTGARTLFFAATLGPLACLLAGLALGGPWTLVAVLSMTGVVFLLDRMIAELEMPDDAAQEFPVETGLSVALAVAHLALVPLLVAALSGPALSPVEKALSAYAAILWLGQIGNANAHELIHRPRRALAWLGRAAFIALLYGHHASAHPKVHHRWVATPLDPATARLGETFFAYAPRAWWGGFRAGHAAETRMLRARHGDAWRRHDPYLVYVGGAIACLTLTAAVGGIAGVAWYVLICVGAQAQILLSDYVQHYGLARAEIAPGRYAPVGPAHSWNAPQAYSGAMMLQAPRHSDHHAHPARPFPQLRLPDADTAPRLPRSLPIMAAVACVPPLWRRLMDPRARAWQQSAAGDAARPVAEGAA
ncbi:alkane 1-monooxygenase [Palleronia salina]|uniref:Alkane 1-monooxygenase n=1 Tax=Palleronia salina TaxID=313368 RepID=A0A1M6LFW3_9RHOB|nr:alkane 1-monooxygenase [Palleronia salina]SHJ70008.1 alkane 1-monooxygenase [Palleronia salina]